MKYFNLKNSFWGIIGLQFHQESLVARVKYAIILHLFSSSIMFLTILGFFPVVFITAIMTVTTLVKVEKPFWFTLYFKLFLTLWQIYFWGWIFNVCFEGEKEFCREIGENFFWMIKTWAIKTPFWGSALGWLNSGSWRLVDVEFFSDGFQPYNLHISGPLSCILE